jgi:hypothetical protein
MAAIIRAPVGIGEPTPLVISDGGRVVSSFVSLTRLLAVPYPYLSVIRDSGALDMGDLSSRQI